MPVDNLHPQEVGCLQAVIDAAHAKNIRTGSSCFKELWTY